MEQDAFTITEQDIGLLRFVVKGGKKEIQNIKISPLLQIILIMLKVVINLKVGHQKVLKPSSKIGRTVSIEFKGGVRLVDINEEEFKYLQAKKELLDWGESSWNTTA